MVLTGDFNINALDYEQNKKAQSFFNLMYRYNMIPTINKPSRVGKNSVAAIYHIIANCIVENKKQNKNKLRDDQLWCSTSLYSRTTPIPFIYERLSKCFKYIGPNNVC